MLRNFIQKSFSKNQLARNYMFTTSKYGDLGEKVDFFKTAWSCRQETHRLRGHQTPRN